MITDVLTSLLVHTYRLWEIIVNITTLFFCISFFAVLFHFFIRCIWHKVAILCGNSQTKNQLDPSSCLALKHHLRRVQSNPLKWMALGPHHDHPLRQGIHLSMFYIWCCLNGTRQMMSFKRVIYLSTWSLTVRTKWSNKNMAAWIIWNTVASLCISLSYFNSTIKFFKNH